MHQPQFIPWERLPSTAGVAPKPSRKERVALPERAVRRLGRGLVWDMDGAEFMQENGSGRVLEEERVVRKEGTRSQGVLSPALSVAPSLLVGLL